MFPISCPKLTKFVRKKTLGHTGASCKALYTYAGNGHWKCIVKKLDDKAQL
jgi:hypothetical protein